MNEDIFAKAREVHELVRKNNLRVTDVAKKMEKTSSYICHLLRLAELPEIIVDGYYSNLVSVSHLFVISRIKDKKKLLGLYEDLLKHNYTVQETEEVVREILYEINSEGKHLGKEEVQKLIETIKEKNNDVEVKVIQTRIKGKIILEMRGSLDQTSSALKLLLQRIGD